MTGKKSGAAPTAQTLAEPSIQFRGEQNGGPERQLKAQLVTLFLSEPKVQRAYLARITAGGEPSVALCMLAPGCNEEALVDRISAIFADNFKRSQQLDMLFLDDAQLASVSKVCRAFYPVQVTLN